jgi:hypothetical protein
MTVHQLLNPDWELIDHRDGNGLNNTRRNLRRATDAQNCRDSPQRRGASQFKGVTWVARNEKWRAVIAVCGKQTSLGYFEHEYDAARAYDAAALKHFGEFACINFPEASSRPTVRRAARPKRQRESA